MQLNAAQVHNPGKACSIIDYDFLGFATGRERERDGSQPVRPVGGCSLLIKRLAFGPVHEPLENYRTIPNSRQGARRNRKVVTYQIEFGELSLLGEVHLVRVSYADLASFYR